MDYFEYVPSELIELLISKLGRTDEIMFRISYPGLGYDKFNVIRLRYPYLIGLLSLKRSDVTDDLYNIYNLLAMNPATEIYLKNETVSDQLIKPLSDIHIRSYTPPLILDVYRKLYPDIFNSVTNVNMTRFSIAIHLINIHTNYIKALDTPKYLSSTEYIVGIDTIQQMKDKYRYYIENVNDREIDGVLGFIFQYIFDKYKRESKRIDPGLTTWMAGFTTSRYREQMNMPLLPSMKLPSVTSSYIL